MVVCALAEPTEAMAIAMGWAAWIVLDFVVTFVIVNVLDMPLKNTRVLAAIVMMVLIAWYNDSCSVPVKSDEKKERILQTMNSTTSYDETEDGP